MVLMVAALNCCSGETFTRIRDVDMKHSSGSEMQTLRANAADSVCVPPQLKACKNTGLGQVFNKAPFLFFYSFYSFIF